MEKKRSLVKEKKGSFYVCVSEYIYIRKSNAILTFNPWPSV